MFHNDSVTRRTKQQKKTIGNHKNNQNRSQYFSVAMSYVQSDQNITLLMNHNNSVMSVTTEHTKQLRRRLRPWRSTVDRGLHGQLLWHQRHTAKTLYQTDFANSSHL